MLAVVLFPMLLGAALLVLGLIGRREGAHPACRKCKFDLTGLRSSHAEPPQASVQRCPECGADLAAPGAVQAGVRVRRRVLITLGAALLLASLSITALALWQNGRGFNWNTIKPTSLLLWEAQRLGPSDYVGVFDELCTRRTAGLLSAEQDTKLAEAICIAQVGGKTAWNDKWGDAFLGAAAAGRTDRAQVERFIQNGITLRLAIRKRTRQGDSWPLTLDISVSRMGQSPAPFVWADFVALKDDEGHTIKTPTGSFGFGLSNGSSSTGLTVNEPLPPGRHALTGEIRLKIDPPPVGDAPFIWTVTLVTLPTEVVMPDVEIYRRLTDEAAAPGIRSSLGLDSRNGPTIKLAAIRPPADSPGKPWRLECSITVSSPPLPVAWEAFAVLHGREHRLCNVTHPAGMASSSSITTSALIDLDQPPPASADLVLRPSELAASLHRQIECFWGGEISIPAVPITIKP